MSGYPGNEMSIVCRDVGPTVFSGDFGIVYRSFCSSGMGGGGVLTVFELTPCVYKANLKETILSGHFALKAGKVAGKERMAIQVVFEWSRV